ncbi:YjgF-like protein [Teratosphaeria destructans]|uniref:YjgF-like protein n=1 Tax=Teratosphaeria destructans TaxID=418781 RepID=A0A9W7SN18_9PEZI|nr:YjgF-like protein [Teratosphaeria destructans]
MANQSQTINPQNVPVPQPQFSQVNTIELRGPAKLIAITGQLSINLDGTPNAQPFEAQVRLALQNLENCLEAAGASKRDIFKVTHHVVDFDYEKQNPAQIFTEWLGIDHRPASAMLPAYKLAAPGLLYETETWAIVPGQ